jgi:hypothetical protein
MHSQFSDSAAIISKTIQSNGDILEKERECS